MRVERMLERSTAWLARQLPARLRQAVVVDAFVRASDPRRGGPVRGGYAGPDGLTYQDAYKAAGRTRREDRAARQARRAFEGLGA